MRFCFRGKCAKSPRGARALARAARTVRVKALREKRLRKGSRVRLWITKRGAIGQYIEYRIRENGFKRVVRCLPVGSLTPKTRCGP